MLNVLGVPKTEPHRGEIVFTLQKSQRHLLCIVRIVKKNCYHFLRSTLSQNMPSQLTELSTLHSLLGPFPCQVSLPLLHHPR